jgi:hypothetical protein
MFLKIRSSLLASALLFLMGTAVSAQQPSAPQPTDKEDLALLVQLITAETEAKLYALAPEENKDKSGATRKVAEVYARIAQRPTASQLLLSTILSDYSSDRYRAQSAMQVSQTADEASVKLQMLMIAQNQRIIELLEQIARKR